MTRTTKRTRRRNRRKPIKLTEAQFHASFKLRPNPINPRAPRLFPDRTGQLFKPSGRELSFVLTQHLACVWTLADPGNGELDLLSGLCLVRCLGYFVTTTPVPFGTHYVLEMPVPADAEVRSV